MIESEFISTRKEVSKAEAMQQFNLNKDELNQNADSFMVYEGRWFIDIVNDKDGKYSLTIGQEELRSDSIETLEVKLYHYVTD